MTDEELRIVETAHEMYNETLDMIHNRLILFRDETDNLLEAWSLRQMEDVLEHSGNAFTHLTMVQSYLGVLIVLRCIEDGSWPELGGQNDKSFN